MSDTSTPESQAFHKSVRGTPLEMYWSAIGKLEQFERERDEARAALSGRTVSCSQCNEAAKQIDAMREAIKEASDALFRMVGACRRYLEERPWVVGQTDYDKSVRTAARLAVVSVCMLRMYLLHRLLSNVKPASPAVKCETCITCTFFLRLHHLRIIAGPATRTKHIPKLTGAVFQSQAPQRFAAAFLAISLR